MRHAHANDRLSWGDALFLYLEREGMPLNIAGVSIFEGAISLDDCRKFVASKLPLIPRYRQRVAVPAFNLGLPVWEYDPEFDIANHVREVQLKRGTDAELKTLTGNILSKVMDRRRPLWDFTVVNGLKGNRSAILSRLHHCMADGIAGIGIMSVLMVPSPTASRVPKKNVQFRPPQPVDPWTLLLDGLLDSYSNVIERLLTAQSDVVQMGQKLLLANGNGNGNGNGANGNGSPNLMQLLAEATAPTQRLSFNVTCRGPQKFAWAEIPVADIKAVKAACHATFNDVVLAVVTSTIRRYAELHHNRVRGRLLRIMVPVNMRANGKSNEVGNRISLVPVSIPLDIRSPRKLVSAIHQRTQFLKGAHAAELIGFAGNLFGITPTAIQALAGPIASALPVSVFNMVCTTVPGPDVPLYFLGHKMLRWYPYVPIGGEMALNCAILSYDGNVYFGFSGDVHAVPDLTRLEQFLKISFDELHKLAGGPAPKPARRNRSRRAKASPVAKRVERKPLKSVEQPRALPIAQPLANKAVQPVNVAETQSALAAAAD